MITKNGKGLIFTRWAVLLVVVACFFAYGCRNSKQEVTSTVQNLLKAAYEKNSAQVRRYVDFDAMLDRSLKEQGIADIDADRKKNIINGLVESACQLSKEDYQRALQTMKVEVGPNGNIAAAVYSTLGRTDITLTLEKKKTGWVVTAIE
jgi:flagellar motor component MotA